MPRGIPKRNTPVTSTVVEVEKPGQVSQVPFYDPDDFHTWKFKMKTFLHHMKCYGGIDSKSNDWAN